MKERIIFAGFGGQGVLFMGKLLSFSMMHAGKNVTYIPSYGAEMRGGTANCHVTISDTIIASPLITLATTAVVMNQPSYEKFRSRVVEGGHLFINSSLIKMNTPPANVKTLLIPATETAHKLGSVRLANMVMFGALNEVKKLMEPEFLFSQLSEFLGAGKSKLFSDNKTAILEGARIAKELLS
ncbi:MAG: 2-oxoacid:acceptor oxidoreductase family protein [Planctomycetota bacterium]|nr:2-oxoacid:acceptor oxidoreductase family protein [Planctomycetota bacterium]